jgi:hypothetical protein
MDSHEALPFVHCYMKIISLGAAAATQSAIAPFSAFNVVFTDGQSWLPVAFTWRWGLFRGARDPRQGLVLIWALGKWPWLGFETVEPPEFAGSAECLRLPCNKSGTVAAAGVRFWRGTKLYFGSQLSVMPSSDACLIGRQVQTNNLVLTMLNIRTLVRLVGRCLRSDG